MKDLHIFRAKPVMEVLVLEHNSTKALARKTEIT
jgi:hypothetical protein